MINTLLIILIICLLYFWPTGVKFLSAGEGRAVFNKHALWNHMNNYELTTRVGAKGNSREALLAGAKKAYENAIMDFTLIEKQRIKNILAGKKVKLIKINGIDNDNPYTIGDYIVLPAEKIKNIDDEKYFKEIINHELYHIYQRKNQKEINKEYRAAGMNDVNIFNIEPKTPMLFNPDDEINIKWMIYINESEYVLPTLTVDSAGRPIQKILHFKIGNDGIYYEQSSALFDESPYKQSVYDAYFKIWPNLTAAELDKMGNNRHSPNEIMAVVHQHAN